MFKSQIKLFPSLISFHLSIMREINKMNIYGMDQSVVISLGTNSVTHRV